MYFACFLKLKKADMATKYCSCFPQHAIPAQTSIWPTTMKLLHNTSRLHMKVPLKMVRINNLVLCFEKNRNAFMIGLEVLIHALVDRGLLHLCEALCRANQHKIMTP